MILRIVPQHDRPVRRAHRPPISSLPLRIAAQPIVRHNRLFFIVYSHEKKLHRSKAPNDYAHLTRFFGFV